MQCFFCRRPHQPSELPDTSFSPLSFLTHSSTCRINNVVKKSSKKLLKSTTSASSLSFSIRKFPPFNALFRFKSCLLVFDLLRPSSDKQFLVQHNKIMKFFTKNSFFGHKKASNYRFMLKLVRKTYQNHL